MAGPTGSVENQYKAQVPEQVLRQAEEAERLHQEFMASLEKPVETPVIPEVKTEPVEKPVVKEEPSEIDVIKQAKEKAEHQYRVLQGKYNAEVPEFALKLTEALNKIGNLQAELDAAKSSIPVKPSTEVHKAIDDDPSIQYVKTDLPDVWKAVNLVIDQRAGESAAEIKRLEREIESTKKEVAVSDREKFYSALSGKVEGWETINTSPEWIEWLKQPEPYSGQTRQELINDAYNKMDSKRTVTFFTDYINESGLVKEVKPRVETVVEEKVKKHDIVPATTVTKKPDVDITTKVKSEIINASEVTQYYRELERLTKMGQKIPDDLAVRGIQIDRAMMEGRIQ